jgi:RecB family exonuclease
VSELQHRRLVRARDLRGFRQALVRLAVAGDALAATRRAMILPTRASIELFRKTLEKGAVGPGRAIIVPELLTRDEWIGRLHQDLPGAPRLLTRFEREILMERSARQAAGRPRMAGPPFDVRPGLVAEMLGFYDELRRRRRTVRRFAHTLFAELGVERGTDRGSESLIHQTCFLGFSFLAYERGMAASGAIDEHELRRRLAASRAPFPFDHIVVAVADHPSDPRGLWPADFDLLSRIGGVRQLDVVVTDEVHDAGLRDRLEQELPGIEEARMEAETPASSPVLLRPASDDAGHLCFVDRDREEELRTVARIIRRQTETRDYALRESTAIVFQRPLPYLYLAQQVLGDARVPFQALDALPLAGEPYAALLDLLLEVACTGGTRESIVALLRSPLLQFPVAQAPIDFHDAAALDGVLRERRATGEAGSYSDEVAAYFGGRGTRNGIDAAAAARAASAAGSIGAELRPFREAPTGEAQVRAISSFLRDHQRGPDASDPWREPYLRARAAVLALLDGFADACRRHDDRPRPAERLAGTLHHWVERQTFAPGHGRSGVSLVDAVAARFGEIDHVHLVGLVETEWPERPRRSIFYSSGLLKSLGWPQENDQVRSQQAVFRDLLALPSRTLHLHAFQLEGDAIVALSPLIDLARAMPSAQEMRPADRLVFADELLTTAPPVTLGLSAETAEWLRLRVERPALVDPRYSGFVGLQAAQAYRVSRVDHYVDCPFKYFAENVLGLPEERDEFSGLSPLERGTLVHALFEQFYRQWQEEGRGTITPATLSDALELFGRLTREALSRLPDADRALEETRLLGSIVARGMAERVFELEANAGGEIADRLVEFELQGPFSFPKLNGLQQQTIEIRGKADRIDVFANGDLRVVDYKLSRLPDVDTSIQIAVYAHAVRQALVARDGRAHQVIEAMYLAFGDERNTEGKLAPRGTATMMAVEARASDFAGAIDQIEAGRFPPKPLRPADCQWCRYAGVCRKEYAAESV